LLLNAKRAASARGVTLSVFVEDAVRAQLARNEAMPVSPFTLHTVRGRLVQPGLELDRASALFTHDDEAAFKGN
jgi:hypothetical protein